MINFIIVDDNIIFGRKIENMIDRYFIKDNINYKTNLFVGYNEKLSLLIKSVSPKIYFLDIEMEGTSGIDIARRIREKDLDSLIIFVTSHFEKTYEVLKAQVFVLDFLIKNDLNEKSLNSVLKKAINNLYNNNKIIIKNSGITYITYIKDIYCVIKNSSERSCIIKTNKGDILTTKTIKEIQELSNNYLFKSHRSCLVNISRIAYVDWQNSKIFFDNDEYIYLLSRDKKKELKKYVEC